MQIYRKKTRRSTRGIAAHRRSRVMYHALENGAAEQGTAGVSASHAAADHDASNHGLGSFYAAAPLVSMARLQAKLTIGKANDPYEREADAVAEHVVSGKKTPVISAVPVSSLGRVEQAQQGAEEAEKENLVQSKATSNKSAAQTTGLQSRVQSLKGGGQSLPDSERGFF